MALNYKFTLSITFIIAIGSLYHLWLNRYYARFIPIPISLVHLVDIGSIFLPSFQGAEPKGEVDLPTYDLTSHTGLRKTLDSIQVFSPFEPSSGLHLSGGMTFDKWAKELKVRPMKCTDGTQLFLLAAWKQGLKAREWHLLPSGWPSGQGHSVVEFFNPDDRKWQLVDAQHAAIIKDEVGRPLSMSQVLTMFNNGNAMNIHVDYGSYKNKMMLGGRGATTEQYFFVDELLKTPVLQLRQATWFAEIEKNWGLSGHLIIGYPIIMANITHHPQMYLTKLTLLGFFISSFLLIFFHYKKVRYRF